MTIFLFTLFPSFFETPLQTSIIKRAQEFGKLTIKVVDIRNFTSDKHRTTDDRPFGGGPGMVMKVEPIHRALEHYNVRRGEAQSRILLTSAKGPAFSQAAANTYAQLEKLSIICGHYEGVDERVAEHLVDAEVRIGDYVLTGGEPAAVVITDAVTRLLPGVLGNENSTSGESHDEPGKLGFPQYTRPEEYQGWKVPVELMTGNHQTISQWREEQREKK